MNDFQPYALATLHLNRMGHLELWQGGMIAAGKREADVYMQLDSDVQAVLEALPAHQRDAIDDGWTQETYHVTDEYFQCPHFRSKHTCEYCKA